MLNDVDGKPAKLSRPNNTVANTVSAVQIINESLNTGS
jgi:hypothetical protein